MKQAVFSIIGSTAVGKTDASFELAKFLLTQKYKRAHLISADSRQVYQGLEVLTGADVPEDFAKATSESFEYPYFEKDRVLLHGIGIIGPSQEWSVAHFQQLALPIIASAEKHDEAVILVGGTGLYHDHLFSEDTQLQVAPNADVRSKAEKLSLKELQEWLESLNSQKLQSLNNSDLQNPRRLIRAIEISLDSSKNGVKNPQESSIYHHYFGITAPLDFISEKISKRVKARFSRALREVEIILSNEENITKLVRTTLGFSQLSAFLNEQVSKEQAQEIWTTRELQYAKRQLTWWKKRPEVIWIDRLADGWSNKLSKTAKKLLAVKPEIT